MLEKLKLNFIIHSVSQCHYQELFLPLLYSEIFTVLNVKCGCHYLLLFCHYFQTFYDFFLHLTIYIGTMAALYLLTTLRTYYLTSYLVTALLLRQPMAASVHFTLIIVTQQGEHLSRTLIMLIYKM